MKGTDASRWHGRISLPHVPYWYKRYRISLVRLHYTMLFNRPLKSCNRKCVPLDKVGLSHFEKGRTNIRLPGERGRHSIEVPTVSVARRMSVGDVIEVLYKDRIDDHLFELAVGLSRAGRRRCPWSDHPAFHRARSRRSGASLGLSHPGCGQNSSAIRELCRTPASKTHQPLCIKGRKERAPPRISEHSRAASDTQAPHRELLSLDLLRCFLLGVAGHPRLALRRERAADVDRPQVPPAPD